LIIIHLTDHISLKVSLFKIDMNSPGLTLNRHLLRVALLNMINETVNRIVLRSIMINSIVKLTFENQLLENLIRGFTSPKSGNSIDFQNHRYGNLFLGTVDE